MNIDRSTLTIVNLIVATFIDAFYEKKYLKELVNSVSN